MDYYEIQGGNKLFGSVKIEKSKNAILPIMAASIMSKGIVTIKNVPNFSDIFAMAKILESIGAIVNFNNGNMHIDPSKIDSTDITIAEAGKIRASVFLMGPLIARFGLCKLAKPGGCSIGQRPIDIHLDGFKTLGIDVTETQEFAECKCNNYVGGIVKLRMPSVGATENLIMCAVLAKSKKTTLIGTAKEPEVVDLCKFLNKMGAKIKGAGTNTITIVGVEKLTGTDYTPIGDRIIAGTYLLAAAMCGGSLRLCGTSASHNKSLIDFLRSFGCKITSLRDIIYISSSGNLINNCSISTGPYPEFATDLQSQTMALLCCTDGIHLVQENLFESRFKQVPEFVKMGANISVDGQKATIFGKTKCFVGRAVSCHDLRGGAALVLAGLVANGKTIIENVQFIDRGYEKFEQKLASVGAVIHRKSNEEKKHNRN